MTKIKIYLIPKYKRHKRVFNARYYPLSLKVGTNPKHTSLYKNKKDAFAISEESKKQTLNPWHNSRTDLKIHETSKGQTTIFGCNV